MHLDPRPPGRGPAHLYVLSAALLLLVLLGGGAQDIEPLPVAKSGCAVDVNHPLELRVIPLGPIEPGALVTARVELEARLPLDGVTLQVLPPAGVTILSRPRSRVGTLAAGRSTEDTITLIAPPGPERATVEVRAEGFVDGARITRGAVLNLVFEEEPFRMVDAPDGGQIREVRARRVSR